MRVIITGNSTARVKPYNLSVSVTVSMLHLYANILVTDMKPYAMMEARTRKTIVVIFMMFYPFVVCSYLINANSRAISRS